MTTRRPMLEPTRRYDANSDRLPHHYLADTAEPFDVAEEISAGIPGHIETALQRRAVTQAYAHPSTVNHQRWRDEHCACLATGDAPSAPRLPRRRLTWLGRALLWVLRWTPAAVVIVGALLVARGLLGGL